MRTQPFKINEEVLKEIEYLASNGMNGADLIEMLPISEGTFYKYKRIAKSYEDHVFTDEEFSKLPEKDQVAIQMMQSFKRGQMEYRKKELPYFANCSDPRIRFKLFQTTFKAYRETMRYDIESFDADLSKLLSFEHKEFVLRALADDQFIKEQIDLADQVKKLEKEVQELKANASKE